MAELTSAIDFEPAPADPQLLEERRHYYGGSDAGVVLGLNRYRSAWDLYAEKTGLVPPWPGNERTHMGSILEPVVADEYARRRKVQVRRVPFWLDTVVGVFGGHPDRIVLNEKRGLECKTFDARGKEAELWSQPGEPVRVPHEYYLQCQWYMGLRPAYVVWDIAVAFGARRIGVYPIEARQAVIRTARERVLEFHEKYVAQRIPPPIEPTETAKRWLATLGKETEEIIRVPEADEIALSLRRTNADLAKLKKEKAKLEVQVKALIGHNLGLEGPGYVIKWSPVAPKTKAVTDWEGLLLEYSRHYKFQVQAADIINRSGMATLKKGYRRISSKFEGDEPEEEEESDG